MLSQEFLERNVLESNDVIETNNVAQIIAGSVISLCCTFGPFLLSFSIANSIGLTSVRYPGASQAAAITALVIVVLSLVLALDLSKRSAARIAATSSLIFAVLGVLTSLTM